MFRSLNTAASGMIAQQLNLDNIANNLANASTAGFRKRRLQFQDLLYQNLVMPGAASTQQTTYSAGLQIGLGARSSASEMIQTQGDLTATGNQLDVAIQGNGFFQVQLPSGDLAYTRSGAFQLSAQGASLPRMDMPFSQPSPFRTMRRTSQSEPTARSALLCQTKQRRSSPGSFS